MNTSLVRPRADEYPAYYARYIDKVPEGDILDLLARQIQETRALLESLDESSALFRYAPGKWSVKEVIGHLCDSERVFAYRGMRFARGDATPLPGFAEDDYVAAAGFDRRTVSDLLSELEAARAASISLFRTWTAEDASRRGTANNVQMIAAAVPYIVAGHERHHRAVLQERYLNSR